MARWTQLADEKVRVAIDDQEYALEPESDADDGAVPATLTPAENVAGAAGGRRYDGHEIDPQNERRRVRRREDV
jgi:hypothetical protein